jgi:hypothetical protein
MQSTEEDDVHEWIWETVFTPEDEIDEAVTVAKYAWSRRTRASAISHRIFVWQQQDPIVGERDALDYKTGYGQVREVCKTNRKGCGAEGERGAVQAHR